jgi:uncharacterized protein YbaR (Trm112 family)
MSHKFSLSSWALGILRNESCIESGRTKFFSLDFSGNPVRDATYYRLAEDQAGEHLPYPKLPRWAKRLFDWRIRIGVRCPALRCRRRGYEFQFRCPECNHGDFFSMRGRSCIVCGSSFDQDMNTKWLGYAVRRQRGLPPYDQTSSDDELDDPFADTPANTRREDTSPRMVPRDVLCCPYCKGDLILEIEEWDIDTGAPTEINRVWCKRDWDVFCGDDVEPCNAGGYGWLGVTYGVLEWAKENVSVYPCVECGMTGDRPGEASCSACQQKAVDEWNAHPVLDLGGVDG